MRYHFRRLERKAEARRNRKEPARQLRFRRQRAKGVVHLNGIEPRCVVLQKAPCRQLGRVEAWLPRRVGPAGSAREQPRGEISHAASLLYACF